MFTTKILCYHFNIILNVSQSGFDLKPTKSAETQTSSYWCDFALLRDWNANYSV